MAQTDYPMEAFERLKGAVEALDERTKDVLAYHLVMERELDRGLAALLPRPESVFKLGFGQKVRVFQATSDSGWTDQVAAALVAFNDLRNSVAHGDAKRDVDAKFRAACNVTAKLAGVDLPPEPIVAGLASAIFMALTVDIDARSVRSAVGH